MRKIYLFFLVISLSFIKCVGMVCVKSCIAFRRGGDPDVEQLPTQLKARRTGPICDVGWQPAVKWLVASSPDMLSAYPGHLMAPDGGVDSARVMVKLESLDCIQGPRQCNIKLSWRKTISRHWKDKLGK
jgi:hypothetical protein